jgi:phosphoribosylformimino-5-aminoimidazole carboxamide ribonucleotide (ProFAR) isomerase
VPSEVPSHFAAAGGVTNVNSISQVKRFDQRGQIIGVCVHLVSFQGCLDRALRF